MEVQLIKLQYLDKYIEEQLLEQNAKREEEHEPSGKLSASMLGYPAQWQILKTIGVPKPPLEEYVIRKFRRGDHVEEWLTGYMSGIVNKQKYVEYRDTIGFVDAIVDMRDWNLEQYGTIPHEIKSVTNFKFKHIVKNGGADEAHALQACLYALALGSEHFAIDYVASDDYRVETILYKTSEFSDTVDSIIDTYNEWIKKGQVPTFEARYDWQSQAKYSQYPEFTNLNAEEIEFTLQKKYPEAYSKLREELYDKRS